MLVQAGLRTLHEAGPEVKRAISGNLEELADVELETNTRRNMPFFGSVIQVGHRIVKSEDLQSRRVVSRCLLALSHLRISSDTVLNRRLNTVHRDRGEIGTLKQNSPDK